MSKFFYYLLANHISYSFYLVALIYGAHHLFDTPYRKGWLKSVVLFPALIALTMTPLSFIDLQDSRFIAVPLAMFIILLEKVIFFVFIKKYTQSQNSTLPVFLLACYTCIENIVILLQQYAFTNYPDWFANLPIVIDILTDLFWYAPFFICAIAICKLLSHRNGFRQLLDYPLLTYVIAGLFFLIDFLTLVYAEALRSPNYEFWNLYISAIFLALFIAVLLLVREVDRSYHLTYSKKIIEEQNRYVEHIEALYNDLQKLQHDHKNLLSGMYLQVKERRMDEVEKYLTNALSATDENLQASLREQKQLGNVKIVEVKSLLFTKMLWAKELGVRLNLEVINPVYSLSMEISDFIRVLGIALDNAIEAAAKIDEQAVVDVLLIQENGYVELLIQNPYVDSIDTEKIWEMGYSTKGKNRGIGLATYKEILDNYAEVLQETKISDNQFIHSLIIPA